MFNNPAPPRHHTAGMNIHVNGQTRRVPPGWEGDSLLSVLREAFGLVGAKFGCGVGLCGACTVLVDGKAERACLLQAAQVQGRGVVTLEGLAEGKGEGGQLHPVQQAWLSAAVPQCGYCQAGQVMGAVALLRQHPQPSDAQIDEALSGHLCRCGTQQRIRIAIKQASGAAR
jgi:isoquinoline 1-oxidoreductase subunit alpha